MSLQIDKDTKISCAKHSDFEFEASYNLNSNEIVVRGMCPQCLKEARDVDARFMQKQLDDYHKGHIFNLGGKPNLEWKYPYKTLRICLGDHGAHELCTFLEFQKTEKAKE